MADHSPLIATIVVGLVVAFIMGALAHRLRKETHHHAK